MNVAVVCVCLHACSFSVSNCACVYTPIIFVWVSATPRIFFPGEYGSISWCDVCVSDLWGHARGGSFVRFVTKCQEEEQSGSGGEPTSGRSSGQTERDDDKDTDRDRRAVTHP